MIDIDGDGSFLMNIQELATAHIEGIAVKVIILNNQHLGMVVQWEDRFHGGNRGHTFLGIPKTSSASIPIMWICARFGVPCERVQHKKDVEGAIKRMLDSKETYVLDIMTPYTEHVLPMISLWDDLQGHHHRVRSAFRPASHRRTHRGAYRSRSAQ